jgi:poly(3-hydroxybutyrate) depolymerase
MKRPARQAPSIRLSVSLTMFVLACSAAPQPGSSGGAGASASSGAGGASGSSGDAGVGGGGAGSVAGATGAAGQGGAGAGGDGGSAVAGSGEAGATGAAGQGAAGQGVAGATGAAGRGDAGASGGAAGGAAGAGVGPRGPSVGCGSPPATTDSSTKWTEHDITVSNVDPAFIAAHPSDPAGGASTWTRRNYFLKLPTGYDPSKPYIVSLGGTGCSGNDTVGMGGGYYLDQYVAAAKSQVLDVSLSYVVYTNTSKPACFADDYVDSPEPQYLDAILADLESKYCVDRGKVFIHGHSSGAWEALTLGCARADVLRGVATQVGGGLRMHPPPCEKTPVATIYVEGLQDIDNPIGPLAPGSATALDLDSLGSAPARDDLLARNGCVGNDTKPWDAAYPACVQYTGCPAAAPVVWCAIASDHNIGANATLRDQYAYNAIWKFWTALP